MEQRTKVVIADSNEDFRAVVTMLLKKEGFEIVGSTGNGLTAMELIAEKRPDIVLTDLVLSGTDGFTLLERSAKLPKDVRPSFIVVSGFASKQIITTAENMGAAYFIQKPCEPASLLSRVKMFACKDSYSAKVELPEDTDTEYEDADIKGDVTEIMHKIGFPVHIKGYQYLREAIMRAAMNMDIINAITKELYPEVAKKYNTTSSRVERAIRHAIELAWSRCDANVMQQYFGCTSADSRVKPTNSEFIALIADKLNVDRKAG